MRITLFTSIVGGLVALGLLLFMIVPPSQTFLLPQPSISGSTTQVVATVGSRSITLAEVERAAALPLYQIDAQRAKLLHTSLQHLIDEELLTAEAARLGLAVPILLEQATQSETVARLANLPAPVRQATRQSQEKRVTPLDQPAEEVSRIRQALLVQLRRATKIHVNPLEPELPVLNVSTDDAPWRGTAKAPITIVEFSDFECPYCKRSLSILDALLAQYPGQLKLVYRDFPGPNHHQALSAAEAAQCAAEQNQFWTYHDALFNNQDRGATWDFSALAKGVGLQPSLFDGCMEEHRYREKVMKALQDGLKLGITSTPTFFINGRPLVGARPLADFQAIIDPLLSHRPRSTPPL